MDESFQIVGLQMSTVEAAAPKPKKPLTERQKRIRKKARELATAQGKDWKVLPQEERKVFRQQVIAAMKARRAAKQVASAGQP